MNPAAIWDFIAGESRVAPLGVAIAVAVAAVLVRADARPELTGALFAGAIAIALAASVFERPKG